MDIIMSIKPWWTERLLNGEKNYEFRRKIFTNSDVSRILIYCTTPKRRFVGYMEIDQIIEGSPEYLWETCSDQPGITKDNFFKYFEGVDYGYGIKIRNPVRFPEEIDPKTLDPNFRPPQSFRYTGLLDRILSTI